MKRAAVLLALLTLSGCAHTRYVVRDCVSVEQLESLRKAEPPKVQSELTGEADKDLRIVGGSAIRLRGYAHGLLDVLGGCAS